VVGKIFKVIFSRDATKQLRKIDAYHKRNASNAVAKKVREGLLEEAKNLKKLPGSKPLLATKKKSDPPYRYTKKWSFKIIFQIFKKKDTVSVVEIIHDKESPEKWEER
jgi:plasmid stabilization system protein ParE